MHRHQFSILASSFAALMGIIVPTESLWAQSGPVAPPPITTVPSKTVVAPEVLSLSLEGAKQRALASNKMLDLARWSVKEKHYAATAARKDFFPKVIGSDTYFRFDRELGTVVSVEHGTRGILPPGTTTHALAVFNENSNLATLFVAQPITKLIAVDALTKIAQADEAIASAKLDGGTRELLSGVTQIYYGLVGALRIQGALQLQQKALEQMLAAKPSADLKLALLEVRKGIIDVETQIRELNDQLNDLLDIPSCVQVEVEDPLPPQPPVACAEETVQLALACNPEVREAMQLVAKAEAGLQVARMDYLPDVNIIGGWANQTSADYIQPNIGYVGVTASYTFLDWGKRRDIARQRQTQITMGQKNVCATRDKVALEARKTFAEFQRESESLKLAAEVVKARQDAEKEAATPAAMVAAKGETAKAELDQMKAEIAYRVAHAKLMKTIGQE